LRLLAWVIQIALIAVYYHEIIYIDSTYITRLFSAFRYIKYAEVNLKAMVIAL